MFSLEGRSALVTGASGGIGQEISKALVKAGAKVMLTGTRERVLENLCKELGEEKADYLISDLSDQISVAELYRRAEEKTGGIDILVSNAGITRDGLTLRLKESDWDYVLKVNLYATFKLNQDAAKSMIKRRFGRIINITSVVGWSGNLGQANYCASKAGVTGMTKAIAAEVATRGVTVNCIAPGFIESSMTAVLHDDVKSKILDKVPMQRMGTAAEVSSAVVFLASNEASYITGSTLHVNGGMYMV